MRTIPTDDAVAFSVCRYWSDLGYKYANVLFFDDDYGIAFKESMLKHCLEMGLSHLGTFGFVQDYSSVDKALNQMKASEINVVMFVGSVSH